MNKCIFFSPFKIIKPTYSQCSFDTQYLIVFRLNKLIPYIDPLTIMFSKYWPAWHAIIRINLMMEYIGKKFIYQVAWFGVRLHVDDF